MLWLIYVLLGIVSVLLIGLVLIQDSKAGGLSAAFAGSGDTIVGAGAASDITKVTAVLAMVFVALCLTAGIWLNRQEGTGSVINNDEPAAETLSPLPAAGDTGGTGDTGAVTPGTTGGLGAPAGGGDTTPADTTPASTPPAGTPPAGDGTTDTSGQGGQ